MGNVAVAEELAGSDELAEFRRLDASEPEPGPDGPEPDDDEDFPDEDDEDDEPEEMPHG